MGLFIVSPPEDAPEDAIILVRGEQDANDENLAVYDGKGTVRAVSESEAVSEGFDLCELP